MKFFHSRIRGGRAALALALIALGAARAAGQAAPPAAVPPAPAPAAAPSSPPPAAAATPAPTPAAVRQVRAEMRVLEWQLTNSTDVDFAVTFQGGPGSLLGAADLTVPGATPLSHAARFFLTGMDAGSGSFDAVIDTLQTAGKVSTIYNTSVILTVATPLPAGAPPAGAAPPPSYDASVKSSTMIPYAAAKAFGPTIATTTDFRNSGVALECTAKDIRLDEFVQLQIRSSVTDLTGFINIAKDGAGAELRVPVMDSRSIQNQVLVKNKSIFITGLLKSTRETTRRQGVPWLAELPVLKWFLGNNRKDSEVVELIFLVRPEILDPVQVKS